VTVKLTTTEARSWGISRNQKRHALHTLQAAGWVRVQAAHGKNPLVTLCLHASPWAFQRTQSRERLSRGYRRLS
jgi:MarR-like DNA-binding transcriptional regulator SgrR of sgrS sRNA